MVRRGHAEEGAELAENLAANLPEDARTAAQQDIRRKREAPRRIRCMSEELLNKRVAWSDRFGAAHALTRSP